MSTVHYLAKKIITRAANDNVLPKKFLIKRVLKIGFYILPFLIWLYLFL